MNSLQFSTPQPKDLHASLKEREQQRLLSNSVVILKYFTKPLFQSQNMLRQESENIEISSSKKLDGNDAADDDNQEKQQQQVRDCLTDFLHKNQTVYYYRYGSNIVDDIKAKVTNLMYSIHTKEWKQAVTHFIQLVYNDNKGNDNMLMEEVLICMVNHDLQFPFGKEDYYEQIIDLFIEQEEQLLGDTANNDDDNNNDNDAVDVDKNDDPPPAHPAKKVLLFMMGLLRRHRRSANNHVANPIKEILLLIAVLQSNTCVDVINTLVDKGVIGRDFLIHTKFNFDPILGGWNLNLLQWICHSNTMNPSIHIVTKIIDIGGRKLVMEKSKKYGNTALHFVFWSQHDPSIDIVNKLIDVGGRKLVMEKNEYGDTALHYAAESSSPSLDTLVTKLIDVGGRKLVMEKGDCGYTALHRACKFYDPSISVITKLINKGGKELLIFHNEYVGQCYKSCYPVLLQWDCHGHMITNITVIKTLIEEGIRHNLGGEFGIGGLFNSCKDEDGKVYYDHPMQVKLYKFVWNRSILPLFHDDDETLIAILNEQPILHAAIIAKAPSNILRDIIDIFPQSLSFQDSCGRYAIDVAFGEGLKWGDGLKKIVADFASQQRRTILSVGSHYGLKWGDGMEELVEANHEQIGIMDEKTNLYPFMLAAVGDTSTSFDLTVVFNLLKKRPDVINF